MRSRTAQTASKWSVLYTELKGAGTELSRNSKLEGFHDIPLFVATGA